MVPRNLSPDLLYCFLPDHWRITKSSIAMDLRLVRAPPKSERNYSRQCAAARVYNYAVSSMDLSEAIVVVAAATVAASSSLALSMLSNFI